MKRIALALLVAAGFAASVARADRVSVNGSIHIGSPGYYAPTPGYYAPPVYGGHHAPRGYWRDVTVSVWVPGHWVTSCDRWGRTVRHYRPGHNEYRTQRVWVDGHYAGDRHHRGHDHHRGYDNPRRGHGPRWNG